MRARSRVSGTGLLLGVCLLAGCSNDSPLKSLLGVKESNDAADSTLVDGKRPLPNVNRLHPDNRTAIAYECYYALRSAWWTVSWYWSAGGQVHRSNWAYLLNDPNAYGIVKGWYGGLSSLWFGWPSFYTNMNVYSWTPLNRYGQNTGTYRSHVGQCRYFVNLILFRSGVYQTNLPRYGQNPLGYRPYSQIRLGDVIETTWANGHTAIAVGVLEGSVGSSVRKVVVIDSNFVGDEEIGMHVLGLSGSGVNNLANYRALNLGY